MAEDINESDDIEEEEEEENSGAEAQQTLDNLTLLTGESDRLDDPEEQSGGGGEVSEWAEPSATLSLSTIHTGSRPTDAELLSNLIPEGEVIVEEEEIVRTDEEVGEELDEVDNETFELETPARPPEEPAAPQAAPPPAAEADELEPTVAPAPGEPVAEDEPPAKPVVEAAAPAAPPETPKATQPPVTQAPTEEPLPTETPEPLDATDAVGDEDTAIALDIDPGGNNEVTIANVPSGATLSAGIDNGDGTWTLSAADLEGLTITPPADSDADFSLQVTAGTESTSLDVTVNAVADAPSATAEDAAGQEDTAIALDLGSALSDVDGSESLSLTISGMPSGASLSAGTDNGDGTWTLDADDLDGLTLTVPAGSDDFALQVSATATDEGGDTRTATELVQVDVGDDGFDAGTVGTEPADTLTGTSGDDVISGLGGNDDIDAGDGADTIMAGDGDDHVMGGQGDDLFIFGAGDGSDYFQGGDGWSDTVQIDGVDGGPGGDSGWTLQVDGDGGYTETESGIEFDAEASGVITLSDGSELTFDGVEKLEW